MHRPRDLDSTVVGRCARTRGSEYVPVKIGAIRAERVVAVVRRVMEAKGDHRPCRVIGVSEREPIPFADSEVANKLFCRRILVENTHIAFREP